MGERETMGERGWGGKVAVLKKEKILYVGNAERCFGNTSRRVTECLCVFYRKFSPRTGALCCNQTKVQKQSQA